MSLKLAEDVFNISEVAAQNGQAWTKANHRMVHDLCRAYLKLNRLESQRRLKDKHSAIMSKPEKETVTA